MRGFAEFLVGTLLGVIASQIVLPASTPYLEMWIYRYMGYSVTDPIYMAIAGRFDLEDLDNKPGDLVSYFRIFCGISIGEIKYCMRKGLEEEWKARPSEWKLKDNEPIRVNLIGLNNNSMTISFMNQTNKAAGYMHLLPLNKIGNYAGLSFGCYTGNDQRTRDNSIYLAYYGNLEVIPSFNERVFKEASIEQRMKSADSEFRAVLKPSLQRIKSVFEDSTGGPVQSVPPNAYLLKERVTCTGD